MWLLILQKERRWELLESQAVENPLLAGIYVKPISRCKSCIKFRICAWIETSKAETGSSQTINCGFSDKALAIPIRWWNTAMWSSSSQNRYIHILRPFCLRFRFRIQTYRWKELFWKVKSVHRLNRNLAAALREGAIMRQKPALVRTSIVNSVSKIWLVTVTAGVSLPTCGSRDVTSAACTQVNRYRAAACSRGRWGCICAEPDWHRRVQVRRMETGRVR